MAGKGARAKSAKAQQSQQRAAGIRQVHQMIPGDVRRDLELHKRRVRRTELSADNMVGGIAIAKLDGEEAGDL